MLIKVFGTGLTYLLINEFTVYNIIETSIKVT